MDHGTAGNPTVVQIVSLGDLTGPRLQALATVIRADLAETKARMGPGFPTLTDDVGQAFVTERETFADAVLAVADALAAQELEEGLAPGTLPFHDVDPSYRPPIEFCAALLRCGFAITA
jgi:hypothetical protein